MKFNERDFRVYGPNTTLWAADDAEKARATIGEVYKARQVVIAIAEKGVRTCASRSKEACKLCIEMGRDKERDCSSPINS